MVRVVGGALGETGHVVVRGLGVAGEGLQLAVLPADRVVGRVVGVVGVWHPAWTRAPP